MAAAAVTPMMSRAVAILARDGYTTHIDQVGRIWAQYDFSFTDKATGLVYLGQAAEVITNITVRELRGWMGY